jgi:hypothetical protein
VEFVGIRSIRATSNPIWAIYYLITGDPLAGFGHSRPFPGIFPGIFNEILSFPTSDFGPRTFDPGFFNEAGIFDRCLRPTAGCPYRKIEIARLK